MINLTDTISHIHKTFGVLSLSKHFLEFSVKAVYATMAGKFFIFMVFRLLVFRCVCKSKKKMNLEIFTHVHPSRTLPYGLFITHRLLQFLILKSDFSFTQLSRCKLKERNYLSDPILLYSVICSTMFQPLFLSLSGVHSFTVGYTNSFNIGYAASS